MAQECIQWAVEVDSSRDRPNLEAQEKFVVGFVAPAYDEISQGSGLMSKVESLHFTRIFYPSRDTMGAYVRLRVFCSATDTPQVIDHIEGRLEEYFRAYGGLQRERSILDWSEVSEPYGGSQVEDVFRDYLQRTSQTVCELLVLKQSGLEVEGLLWPWAHFFFDDARGYGRPVLEFAPGAVTGFFDNM